MKSIRTSVGVREHGVGVFVFFFLFLCYYSFKHTHTTIWANPRFRPNAPALRTRKKSRASQHFYLACRKFRGSVECGGGESDHSFIQYIYSYSVSQKSVCECVCVVVVAVLLAISNPREGGGCMGRVVVGRAQSKHYARACLFLQWR